MVFPGGKVLTNKHKIAIISVVLALTIAAAGYFAFFGRADGVSTPPGLQPRSESLDLGITYLPVTPGLAEYYGLEIDSGALVTEVVPDGLAARAGVVAGDVVVSFNGASLEDETPLLGMMMACREDHMVSIEVWSEGRKRTVEVFHTGN